MQLIISLYVDDLLITGPDNGVVTKFKTKLKAEFDMSDDGKMTYFLGLQISQKTNYILVHQKKYASKLSKKFKMENCKATTTLLVFGSKLSKPDIGAEIDAALYRKLIGIFSYLSTTRPDIMYAISFLARFM